MEFSPLVIWKIGSTVKHTIDPFTYKRRKCTTAVHTVVILQTLELKKHTNVLLQQIFQSRSHVTSHFVYTCRRRHRFVSGTFWQTLWQSGCATHFSHQSVCHHWHNVKLRRWFWRTLWRWWYAWTYFRPCHALLEYVSTDRYLVLPVLPVSRPFTVKLMLTMLTMSRRCVIISTSWVPQGHASLSKALQW